MYSLVLRQLSPIQKGVQSAHSIVEYASKFHKLTEYIQWATVDKTIIVLDGGTYPELKDCRDFLSSLKIPYAIFYEPDLGEIITSISFVVEDKVWNQREYPAFEDDLVDDSSDSDTPEWLANMGGMNNLKLRNFLMSKRLSN